MSFLTSIQLCWILSIFFHSVQSMVLDQRWRNAYGALEESSGTTLPVAPWAGFLPASSTFRAETASSPASTPTPSILQAVVTTTSSTLVVPPQSTAIAMSTPSTITSVVTSLATLSATSTKTVMTTIMVSPTTSAAPFENNVPSSTSDASSDAIQSTTPGSMSPTAQIGLGIGLTLFVVVSIAIAGLYFWRRRKDSHPQPADSNMESVNPGGPRNFLKQIFNFRRYRDNNDAEWSIESVEKVSIVKNMRAQSVLTVSRSNSRRSVGSSETGTISIGMRGRAGTMALNSHPMTPSYTAHATKTTEAKPSVPKSEVGESKSNNWPLGR
ncbi:hypothetical protein IQ06DRAFT_350320 [Phaeosphaeriaceae sp. SRC1lsM3a]|nr:hypothetical protein IQ06DRAFT_350320 [Stagonospora sp. SRC1lsM3a]